MKNKIKEESLIILQNQLIILKILENVHKSAADYRELKERQIETEVFIMKNKTYEK